MRFNPDKFKIKPEIKAPLTDIQEKVKTLLVDSIKRRVPDKKFGIMFSGGIDSTIISFICKNIKQDFICYTAVLDEPGLKTAEDLIWAKKVAIENGFDLKIKKIRLIQVEKYIEKIVPIINSTNVVKIGVALPVFLCCEMAKKDGITHMFGGLGSEEIFAGYERHVKSKNINEECLNGLFSLEERDLSRDIPIADHFDIKLQVPFLDNKLIDYALKIPGKYKLKKGQNKVILRQVAENIGIKKEFAQRKKIAAQYGSKFDKGLSKLTKKNGFKYKKGYLDSFNRPKLGALVSGGKDSLYALYKMKKKGYRIGCIIKIISINPDSYMFHTPGIDMVNLQAEALEIPLIEHRTKGIKEKELKDLKDALMEAKDKYGIGGIITGALFSKYQRDRIEKICKDLNLEAFSPLWHMDQETEMREILNNKFRIIFTGIAAEGLDDTWLGRNIKKRDIDKLVKINNKLGINIAGEGGEFESLVLDMPLFSKRINIENGKINMENEHTGRYIIKKAGLVRK